MLDVDVLDDQVLGDVAVEKKLEELVKWLADPMENNWCHMHDDRAAADCVLAKMAELKLIKHKQHRHGGNIWTVNGNKYGRTED